MKPYEPIQQAEQIRAYCAEQKCELIHVHLWDIEDPVARLYWQTVSRNISNVVLLLHDRRTKHTAQLHGGREFFKDTPEKKLAKAKQKKAAAAMD